MDFLKLVQEHKLQNILLQGNFGLEKENVRADLQGNLAQTSHPKIFGEKSEHPYITTDFAESQIEMVTPVFSTPKQALDFMEALHDIVSLELKNEVLWPYSLPPVLPEDDSLIKAAYFKQAEITEYREYLAKKYGKRKQLLSGVHYNFSFNEKFVHLLHEKAQTNLTYRQFKDQVYLKISRNYLRLSWLVIYLFGANSVAHESYSSCCKRSKSKINDDTYIFEGSSSFRNGVSGYRNPLYFYVSYNSLIDYVSNIHQAIRAGKIIAPKEYYSQIRLKGKNKGSILDDLITNGINYLEIRTLDLDPLVKVGIRQEALEFIHLFLIYALLAPDFEMTDTDYRHTSSNQILASDENRHQKIMLHYSDTELKSIEDWGSEVLDSMILLFTDLDIGEDQINLIKRIKERLVNHEAKAVDAIEAGVIKEGYTGYFMGKVNQYLDDSKAKYATFKGFEDLELSTQILLKESIKRGVTFEFLDRSDNFIRLSRRDNVQIIKQATKTNLDQYANVLAMENKWVTKEILKENNINTPNGALYKTLDDALNDYPFYVDRPIVIKPNSTNFGIGVTIFKTSKYSKAEFNRALVLAFSFDKTILVEDYFVGREYRFLVLQDNTIAILHREPANVIGDGRSNITQLVEMKNQDPLRGYNYVTPLEKIQLDEVERMYLARQGRSFESILKKGEKIFLRENSNISTGGDSIDCTDEIGLQFKSLAVACAKSVGAVICGVDMLIKDINKPVDHSNYTIVELNFNPAIHIHTYPYKGEDRKIAYQLLELMNLID